ncbi:hypothetical protein AG1IA_02291 [Rhizoctonia solani AG-1 IA]|uniref:Uncharacterized protein n=1 Tax=Thanatephorus cucumeris (strain AG1-IA) TaxID=983506 RepID=L8X3I5_THACA|nr:hypothetical protein AG1IA_02291 [Rhizoctonia solani AG-1 IA]
MLLAEQPLDLCRALIDSSPNHLSTLHLNALQTLVPIMIANVEIVNFCGVRELQLRCQHLQLRWLPQAQVIAFPPLVHKVPDNIWRHGPLGNKLESG